MAERDTSKDRTFRTIVSVYAFIGLTLLGVILVALQSQDRATRSAQWIDHTRASVTEIDSLLSNLQHAEGAVRSFLLTGAESERAVYREAFNQLGESVEVARAFLSEDAAQLALFEELEVRLLARTDLARELLAEKRTGSLEQLQQRILEDDASEEMYEIQRLAQQLKNALTQRLAEHDREVFRQEQRARTLFFSVAVLTLMTLVGSAWFIRDDLRHRRSLARAGERARMELEATVKSRTADLETANQQLRKESLEMRWRGEALDHQLRYAQRIIDSISDLVFVVTKVGSISRINPAVTRATGFEASELVQRSITDILQPGDDTPTDFPEHVLRAISLGDELRDLAIAVKAPSAETLRGKLRLFPLHDHDKVIGAVVTIQRDS